MGFGLLFIGYFFVYVISIVPFIPKLVGYFIMLVATLKLSDYEVRFKRCIPVLGALGLVSAFLFAKDIFELANIQAYVFNDTITNIISVAEEVLTLLMNALLLISVKAIAESTELDKLSFRSTRNLFVIFIAEAVYLVALFLPDGDAKKTIFMIALGLRVIWIILNLVLIVSCYRMICEEGDEDMPEKEMNIPILKQMEATLNKRNQNAFDAGRNLYNKRKSKKEKKNK